ncbi:MAG: chemotaxis protein CheX [Bacillota bacterium]
MLPARLTQPYIDSTVSVLKDMADVEVEISGYFYPESDDIISYGVSSIITFMGKIRGRLVLDMDPELALKIAGNINSEEYKTAKDINVLTSISELNNIVAGHANTYLNNNYSLGLRLAPPVVFTGKKPIICIPKITSESIDCYTKFGRLRVNVAFEGGA